MATIDLRGIWSSAKTTREKHNEVNRPGYSVSPAKAAKAKTSTSDK